MYPDSIYFGLKLLFGHMDPYETKQRKIPVIRESTTRGNHRGGMLHWQLACSAVTDELTVQDVQEWMSFGNSDGSTDHPATGQRFVEFRFPYK